LSKTILYCGEQIEVSDKVAEFLENDRKCIDAQERSDRRHLSKSSFETAMSSKSSQQFYDTVFGEVLSSIRHESLRRATFQLSFSEKYIIYAYYYERHTMEQVGEFFSISKMAVSKRHQKLLAKLRRRMETYASAFLYSATKAVCQIYYKNNTVHDKLLIKRHWRNVRKRVAVEKVSGK
jgi:DNA-directed RNA polymerase sigma subunit (sigma70/sigma32)